MPLEDLAACMGLSAGVLKLWRTPIGRWPMGDGAKRYGC